MKFRSTQWVNGGFVARVNLEERLFSEARLHYFSELLKTTSHQALGVLSYLWHDSQELKRATASKREIVIWCRWKEIQYYNYDVHGEKPPDTELIAALVESGYISESEPEVFQIHGNEDQIAALDTYRVGSEAHRLASILGGKARAASAPRDEQGHFIPAGTPADSQPAAGPATSRNSIQFNSIQLNSIQRYIRRLFHQPSPTYSPLGIWNAVIFAGP